MGFSSEKQQCFFPQTVECEILLNEPYIKIMHEFLIQKQCPLNLFARDLIAVLMAKVICSHAYTDVIFPDGYIVRSMLNDKNEMLQSELKQEESTCDGVKLCTVRRDLKEIVDRWEIWINLLSSNVKFCVKSV